MLCMPMWLRWWKEPIGWKPLGDLVSIVQVVRGGRRWDSLG